MCVLLIGPNVHPPSLTLSISSSTTLNLFGLQLKCLTRPRRPLYICTVGRCVTPRDLQRRGSDEYSTERKDTEGWREGRREYFLLKAWQLGV